MNVKQRIISIRLLEMIRRDPEYAQRIGIQGGMISKSETGPRINNNAANEVYFTRCCNSS